MEIVAVDTGGTFTDFVCLQGQELKFAKVLSTPDSPSKAVIQGLQSLGLSQKADVVHGTTVATNTILERKGLKTAIITNQGFEDLIEIGRQQRSDLYDLFYTKELPIVPASLRFGLEGRIDSDGQEVKALEVDQIPQLVQALQDAEVEAVALCFLFSYLNPCHEARVAKSLEHLPLHVSQSHLLVSEFREFERLSTTVVNAYISPKMSQYLNELLSFLGDRHCRIMQSNGGSISIDVAMQESVRTILSGPAGGVIGGLEVGKAAGFDRLITFDMGGTSTDVCLLNGDLGLSTDSSISEYPLKIPMLDIHTVGAGGGSLAWIDAGGALKVGPQSAGADPGPICYGKGKEITVTDANLYLGRLVPEAFLDGAMTLETDSLDQAFDQLARKVGLAPVALAEGILNVANTNMERAIRVISVERGHDPREYSLLAFGGAGGMHGAFLARLLSMPRVIIPKNPGLLSSWGMMRADVIKDYSQTVMQKATDSLYEDLRIPFVSLENEAKRDMSLEGFVWQEVVLEHTVDVRYKGQSYELSVPFVPEFVARFQGLHEQHYGYSNPEKSVEVVNIRLRARGVPCKPSIETNPMTTQEIPREAFWGSKKTVFEGQGYVTPVVRRDKLLPGNSFAGPAIVIEYSSTIVVPPLSQVTIDGLHNVILEPRVYQDTERIDDVQRN